MLPCFSKLLEEIKYNRFYTCLSENNLIYENQFGFQAAHSTENATSQLVSQVLDSFNEDKFTLGVFINLSKAFDRSYYSFLKIRTLRCSKQQFQMVSKPSIKQTRTYET